jgi:hypothetical protein
MTNHEPQHAAPFDQDDDPAEDGELHDEGAGPDPADSEGGEA